MNSTNRRLSLLIDLRNQRTLSVPELAKKYEVDRRTIYRDLSKLEKDGFSISFEGHAGVRLLNRVSIPPIEFTPTQLILLIIGLVFMRDQADETLQADARSLFQQLLAKLPQELALTATVAYEKTSVYNPTKGRSEHSDIDWFLFLGAIQQQMAITFSYLKKGSSKTEIRHAVPENLVYYFDHWTLEGWDLEKEDKRSFIVSRMKEISVSTKTELPKPMEQKQSFKSSYHHILLRVRKEIWNEFIQQFPVINYESSSTGNFYELSFIFNNLDYINHWLMQFGTAVEVRGPDELIAYRLLLADQIREQIKKAER